MKRLINILIMLFLSLIVAIIVIACEPTFREDADLRRQIDSAWINTSFQTNPDLCSDLDFYYTIVENIDNGNYRQNMDELDSIVNIIKPQLNIK